MFCTWQLAASQGTCPYSVPQLNGGYIREKNRVPNLQDYQESILFSLDYFFFFERFVILSIYAKIQLDRGKYITARNHIVRRKQSPLFV